MPASTTRYAATNDELRLQGSSTHIATLSQMSLVHGLCTVVECSFSCRIQLSPIPGIFSGGAAIVRLQDLRRVLVILSRSQIDNSTRILAAVPASKIVAHVSPTLATTTIAVCFEGSEINTIRYGILHDCGVPVVTSFFFVQDLLLPDSASSDELVVVASPGEAVALPLGSVSSVAVRLKDAGELEELHLSQFRSCVLNHVLTQHQTAAPVIRFDLPEDRAGVHTNENVLELFLSLAHQRLVYFTDDVRVKAAVEGAKQQGAVDVKDRSIAVCRGTFSLFKKKSALPPPLWSFTVSWFHVSEVVVHDVRATRDFSLTIVVDYTNYLAVAGEKGTTVSGTDPIPPQSPSLSGLVGDDDCAFETALMIKIEFVDSDRRTAFLTAARNARMSSTNSPLVVTMQRGAATVLPYPFIPLWSVQATTGGPSFRPKKSTGTSVAESAPSDSQLADLAFLLQSRASLMIFLYHASICSQNALLAEALATHLVAYFSSLPHVQNTKGDIKRRGAATSFDLPSDRLVEAAIQVGFLAASAMPSGQYRIKEVPLAWEICKAFIKPDVSSLLLHNETTVGDQRCIFSSPVELPQIEDCGRIVLVVQLALRYLTAAPVASSFVAKLVTECAQSQKELTVQIHSDAITQVQAWITKICVGPLPLAPSSFSDDVFSLRNLVATLINCDDNFFWRGRELDYLPSAIDLSFPSHPLRHIFAVHSCATSDMLTILVQGRHAVNFVDSIALRLSVELGRKGSVFVQRHEATQTLRSSSDEEHLLSKYLGVRAKLALLEQVHSETPVDSCPIDAVRAGASNSGSDVTKYADEARRTLRLEQRNDELVKLLEAATKEVSTLAAENTLLRDDCRMLRVQHVDHSFNKTIALLFLERSNFIRDQEACSRDVIVLAADRERFDLLVQLMVPLLHSRRKRSRARN